MKGNLNLFGQKGSGVEYVQIWINKDSKITSGSPSEDLAGVRRKLGFLRSSERGEEEIELE